MKNSTPTPHIEAKKGEISKTVILCGDAIRTRLMVERYLTDVKLVNTLRNNYCFTGVYKGNRVSIMSTGMGAPAMGIYSYELFNFYDVENIIRVGTIGSLNKDFNLGDIIIAESAFTNTNYLNLYQKQEETELKSSPKLLKMAKELANNKENKKIKIKPGKIYSSDTFYDTDEDTAYQISLGVVGIEMECAALYLNAQNAGKNALCMCTVSDEILTDKRFSGQERQNKFLEVAKLVLDLTCKL